mmetsp:Transcript_18428/g.27310  ORF Transcript_18428/g.27310 Transcript_18428/m.27310 type:complete len:192 (+) Transcript_18428:123-698(+)
MLEELWSRFQRFSDEQRLFRLGTCQDIAKCVESCRNVRNSRLSGKECGEMLDLEGCVAGIRMVKYFDWRESQPTRIKLGDGARGETVLAIKPSHDKAKDEIPTCARETHAVWGCRAIALGCAPHMIDLRNCFQESYTTEQVLSVSQFGYENNNNENIPCRDIQRALGECVAREASLLEQRVSASKKADSEN